MRAAHFSLLSSAFCLLPLALSGEPEAWSRLPVGTTPLAELGAYRVAYQLYGEERVEMPPSWAGHFTDDVGIAYYGHGTHAGRRASILHCPWRRGPGWVRLEYPLELPRQTPITLAFGIAMRPDVTTKSDGVTFGAFVVADGETDELLREHYTSARWKDYRFDLSEYAGRRELGARISLANDL